MSAEIMSIEDLLGLELQIPGYQRPYRWTEQNIEDLLDDVDTVLSEADRLLEAKEHYKYRIGTVILHDNTEENCLDIVDGQQRMISLALLLLALNEGATNPLIEKCTFSNRETQQNIKTNYDFIADWVRDKDYTWREKAKSSFKNNLEAVVITVDKVEEAFQLFDSQNTRGRGLDPHDLLKAYHLRAMRDTPYEMRHVVTRWEEFSSDDVRTIFGRYLFPVLNWKTKEKTVPFTPKEIGAFKGVSEDYGYSYAARAKRAAPCFQIGSSFIEGEDFFLMAEHYLSLRQDIELEIRTKRKDLWEWLDPEKPGTAGLKHAINLFWCALFAYYDRFHSFDERAVNKLFMWALMIRVDMDKLGFKTINKYAIGESAGGYSNERPMFHEIAKARYHSAIANIIVKTEVDDTKFKDENSPSQKERHRLSLFLQNMAKGRTE